MRKIVIVLLLLGICIPAFAKHKQRKKCTDIISVNMRRTACFGRCPEYTVEINKDGMLTYTGIRFVPDSGAFEKNIGTKQAAELLDQFKTYHVDTCQDLYMNRIQDVPGIIYTIRYKNNTKIIRNANFGPGFLRQLAGEMDEIGKKTDDAGWKKIDDKK